MGNSPSSLPGEMTELASWSIRGGAPVSTCPVLLSLGAMDVQPARGRHQQDKELILFWGLWDESTQYWFLGDSN